MRKRMPFRIAILLRRRQRVASGQRIAARACCDAERLKPSRKAISLITTARCVSWSHSHSLQTDRQWMDDPATTASTASGQICDYIPTTKQISKHKHAPAFNSTCAQILSRLPSSFICFIFYADYWLSTHLLVKWLYFLSVFVHTRPISVLFPVLSWLALSQGTVSYYRVFVDAANSECSVSKNTCSHSSPI